MEADITHIGSRNNLKGRNPSDQLRDYYSNHLQVTADTPPAFIAQAETDETVSVENSMIYARALAEKGVPVTLCVYPTGTHDSPGNSQWEFADLYDAELEKFLNNLPVKKPSDVVTVCYTFDTFENQYRVCSANPEGVTEADGRLTADDSAEHFIVFESETPMDVFQVSCDIKSLDTAYDAGIVVLANGETADELKGSALCVQIVGTRIRLQRFDAEAGRWKVLKGATFQVPAEGTNVRILCQGNGSVNVFAGNGTAPLFTYQMTDEERALSGDVGLYSNMKATVFDNFTIKSKQYKKSPPSPSLKRRGSYSSPKEE